MNDCVLKVTCCVCISVDYLHENAFHFLYISFYFVSLFYIINKKNVVVFFFSLFISIARKCSVFSCWICAKRKTIRCHGYALMLGTWKLFQDNLEKSVASRLFGSRNRNQKNDLIAKYIVVIITLFRGFRFPFALQPSPFDFPRNILVCNLPWTQIRFRMNHSCVQVVEYQRRYYALLPRNGRS